MEYRSPYKPISIWIFLVIVLVYSMVVVGGLTRLTNSGLSMVNWQPIMGAIPPLSEQEWSHTFEQYKLYPEYQKVNYGMTLDKFKSIYYWEYGHRLLGRFLGFAFFLPYLFFLIKGKIKGSLSRKLFLALLLGGSQGLLGWFMVKSGLIDLPRVSQYRLAAHLCLAFFLLAYLHWIFLSLTMRRRLRVQEPSFRFLSIIFLLVLSLQIFYGALTAGLDAGLMYNTFPDMHGSFIPMGLLHLQPEWKNFFENPVLVQFVHRTLGWTVLALTVLMAFLGIRNRVQGTQRLMHYSLLVAVIMQFVLGVATLLMRVSVDVASLHQAGAGVVLLLAVSNVYLEHRAIRDRVGA